MTDTPYDRLFWQLAYKLFTNEQYERIGLVEDRAIKNDEDTMEAMARWSGLVYIPDNPITMIKAIQEKLLKEIVKDEALVHVWMKSRNQTLKEAA